MPGEPVGPAIELAVGEPDLRVCGLPSVGRIGDHRRRLRRPLDLGLEQLVQTRAPPAVSGRGVRGVVPLDQELLPLAGGEERQARQPTPGIRRRALEHGSSSSARGSW